VFYAARELFGGPFGGVDLSKRKTKPHAKAQRRKEDAKEKLRSQRLDRRFKNSFAKTVGFYRKVFFCAIPILPRPVSIAFYESETGWAGLF
jgi:hypothetical protein